ncbi:hypothetical protein BAUCODRAFT_32335 [Baudoinia panamericana UAMH 10762]|uniref:Zf-UBP-domain-containing protein n=1 Tax=Baudoinia panamericana (strain UAMH 10762) TaxID=717646 RepID=M2MNQ0_BAUPA|nr:uncharacterized protein BAUCODRAFT_32335 [Baudoinia panamericana UAMH 10762]EMC98316.1 hypothetical protein BAUCODRAFT_32335 [Baudoinia panamericana UAMH 10762]
MSSYFFHLKLELYTVPASNADTRCFPNSPASRKVYTPPSGTDIFRDTFPAHATSRLIAKRPGTPQSHKSSDSEASPRRKQLAGLADSSPGDALLLPERNLNLRDIPPQSPALTAAKHSNETSARDWRYQAVSIESIDMASQSSFDVAASKAVKNPVNGLHTKAVYLPSESKTTEVGYGIVHLYRDSEESTLLADGEGLPRRYLEDRRGRASGHGDHGFSPEDCTTLCILAVPSWMMPSDLLGFVGDQAREDVSHFRLIRTGRANKYMVLLKFRSAKKAREWQRLYNGRLFSAAEPENCHVVFIKSVEFLSPDTDVKSDATSFPQNTNDPFTSKARLNGNEVSALTSKSLSSKPLAPPPPNLLELPTCPVCLERMDETTGLLTILCQHVFHCACLEKWRGSGCPVCRYTHSPSYTFPYPRPHELEDTISEPLCSVCTTTNNLWICLICGNIGCGRYDSAHAYAHYEETSHCYAMDISTQHVWDYAGDGYVHRLIQSKPDAKLIDLPTRTRHENEAFRAEGGDSVPREKMESMANEYTYLLTSQLEGQRRYFEEQVERAADKAAQACTRADEAATSAVKSTAELVKMEEERKNLADTVARIEVALAKSEKARQKFEQMAREMSSQLREEKTLNEGLVKRIHAADEKAERAKKEAAEAEEKRKELADLNHDLTMFISGQEKVKELEAQGEEVVDGAASVPEQSKKKGKGKKR